MILVTVSGPDGPGITSELTGMLAKSGTTILDIGQAVIHNLLSLSFLIELDPIHETSKQPLKDLLFKATEMGLKLDYQVFTPDQLKSNDRLGKKSFRYALTLIADKISAQALHDVSQTLAKYKVNIDSIERLSEDQFSCVEIIASSTASLDRNQLKTDLLVIAKENGVDIALQNEGLFRRSKRMIVLDLDSTLIQSEVIDEFAREKGVYGEVSAITERAMQGELDYNDALQQRCNKLKGLTQDEIDRVYKKIELTPGAQELIQILKKLGYKVAVISGGFSCIADRIKSKLGLDFAYSNQLEMSDGKATGKVLTPIVNAQRKADLLDVLAQQEGIHLDQVIAVGDGANDLLMLQKAGLGIAFNAKSVVKEKAHMSLNQKNLRSILYLLGISGRDQSEILF